MTKKITSYKDLLAEKQNLELLLDAQKELIKLEFEEVENQLFPVVNLMNTVSKLATYNSKEFLLTIFSDIFIDLVADVTGLKNKNWIGRIAIPGAMKNLSSHFIANNKDEIVALFTTFIDSFLYNNEDEEKEEELEAKEKVEENKEQPY